MTSPTFTLSPQQVNVLDFIENQKGNGMLIAVAGAGKTSILVEGSSRMRGTVAYCVYNKRNQIEIEPKVAARGLSNMVKVATFHSFGFRAWAGAHRNPKVEPDKIRDLIKTYRHPSVDERPEETVPLQLVRFVGQLVSLVRQTGVGITCKLFDNTVWNSIVDHHALDELLEDKKPWEESTLDAEQLRALRVLGMNWSARILRASIKMADEQNVIDFDDQLFMPLYRNLRIPQYDWVLIDEAQDTNPTRRAMARAMLKEGGRLLAVGDPHQAIYGFTGADSDSLENIKSEFRARELPLTVSFRCPQQVVAHARQWVSHIEAADNAPQGTVEWIEQAGLWDSLQDVDIEQAVVLCRKNAPLVELAFDFIRRGLPCHVEGRDIGGQVKTLAKRWKLTKLTDLLRRVTEYQETETRKFMDKGQEMRADSINDKCDTLKVIAEGLLERDPESTVDDLLSYVDKLFGDNLQSGLTLSSIHKSKGREWPTVFWLGRAIYQPSPFARQDWQHEQEVNLCYVAATRSQDKLIEVLVAPKPKVEKEY